MSGNELRDRVRREESQAARAAVAAALRLAGAALAVVLILRYGAQTLSGLVSVLSVLDRSTATTLTMFPLALFGLGGVLYGVDALINARRWFTTRTLRRRVDRHPELAAELVPPVAAHLATLRRVAGHRRATVRTLGWVAIPVGLLVAVLLGGVTLQAEDGTRYDAPEALPWALGVLGLLTLILLVPALTRWRRWHTTRTVQRYSRDPALGARLSTLGPEPARSPATAIPPLTVTFLQPPPTQSGQGPVTTQRNVLGAPPIRIAYLRLFDNQARVRDFLRGAWREVGYVHLLRSAASVSPAELRHARTTNTLTALFVTSPRLLRAELDRQPVEPLPPGRHQLTAITNHPVTVHDPYGSYPVRSVLCHDSFWQLAVDLLLARADLVVLDLSGYRPANAGTRFELQRVIDRFPLTRAVLLCDPGSDQTFLQAQIRHHWARMAHGSPNSGHTLRRIRIAATDSDYHPLLAALTTRRTTTRWLAAHTLNHTDP